jgi:hypothetical protein
MKIIYVYADSPSEWNCSQWRSLTPSDAINKKGDGIEAKLIHVSGFYDFLNPAIQDLVAPASVIVFQRNLVDQASFDSMEYWQGMGKPVLVDLDDAYHILPQSNPAHSFWIDKDGGEALVLLEDGLRRSNGLIAPNRLLLSDWGHVSKGYYLPNYAEAKWWTDLPSREEIKKELGVSPDKIVIGWGGSVSHYDSWWGSGIREAAIRVANRHPEVLWMVCGNDPRIGSQLPVSKLQKKIQPGVDPSQWPKIVRSFDIGLAPLFGPYDQRRSWIKGLEYLLAGVPWIATRGEPYRDLAEFGKLISNGIDEWEMSIEDMLGHLSQIQEASKEKEQMATMWFAENQVDNFKRLFENIVNDFNADHGRLPGVYYVKTEPKTASTLAEEAQPESTTA